MVGYHRKFIKSYSKRHYNLGLLLRGKNLFQWTEVHQAEFEDLKAALSSKPVMAYPDFDKQFILSTDASISGLGAILSQKFPEGERVIAYASRTLIDSEKNYGITQLEACAIIWAVEHFRHPYLIQKKFKLITDHKALLSLTQKSPPGNRLLERWSIKLQDYDIEAEYASGNSPTMAGPDCLSRATIALVVGDLTKIARFQKDDPYWSSFYSKVVLETEQTRTYEISENPKEFAGKPAPSLYWVNKGDPNWQNYWIGPESILFQTLMVGGKECDRVCLPRELAPIVMNLYHKEGHWGALANFSRIHERYVWPGMRQDIHLFCKTCDICQKCNKSKQFKGKMSYLKVSRRNEVVGIDTFSGLPRSNLGTGNSKILVITDFLTRYTWLVPVPNTEASTVCHALLTTWYAVFGCPENIITDRGSEFDNKLLQELYTASGTNKLSTVGYRPGKVERFNHTMVAFLSKECGNNQTDKL